MINIETRTLLLAASISLIGNACGATASAPETSTASTASTASPPPAGRPAPRPPGDSIERLSADYDLTIATRKTKLGKQARTQGPKLGGNYSWQFLTAAEDPVLDQHLASLLGFWRRFPPSFVERVGLEGIVFTKHLRWNGIQVYGFEVTDGVLFVNLTLGGKLNFPGDDDFRYGLTHEFFHLIQNKLARDPRFVDYDAWDALNRSGFDYHPDGTMGMLTEAQGRKNLWQWLHEEHPEPGFVSRYAMSDHWHDTTETFCALFVTARYRKLVKWMKKDAHLRKKVAYLKAALRRIEPTFTDAYFEQIHRR